MEQTLNYYKPGFTEKMALREGQKWIKFICVWMKQKQLSKKKVYNLNIKLAQM